MEPHVVELLKEIAIREGLQSDFRTTVTVSTGAVKSFHSVVKTLVLEDAVKKVPLVVKTCHLDQLTRSAQRTHDKFSNEVFFYSSIAHELAKYGEFPRIPKLYGFSLVEMKETIVLEDLRDKGFLLIPLSTGLDAAHLTIVAKALAKLHDVSLKWKTRDPISFRQAVSTLKETLFIVHENVECQKLATELFTEALTDGLNCAPDDLKETCYEYIQNGMIRRLGKIDEWMNSRENESNVILHGDTWCHNFFFKYCYDVPVEVAFIDWQTVHYGSPVKDLVQCFLSSANNQELDAGFDFVGIYAEEMNFGCKENLLKDMFHWGKPALLLALSITVNVLKNRLENLPEAFKNIVREDIPAENVCFETRKRIEKMLYAADYMGLFRKYD